MEEILLSIIIPVYNTEQYINDCLKSLVNQDISASMYEIILVNDCSPDRSQDIISNYIKDYANIIYLEHSVNKKQGAARNTGLKIAKGKYIMFVDSDDFLEVNSLSKLVSLLEDKKPDLAFISMHEEDLLGNYHINESISYFEGIRSGLSLVEDNYVYNLGPCSKIYRRDLLFQYDIFFAENVQLEDVDFSVKSVLAANHISCLNWNGYYYRYNTQSTVRSSISLRRVIDGVELANRLLNIALIYKKMYPKVFERYEKSAAWTLNNSVKMSLFLSSSERKQLKIYIKNTFYLHALLEYLNRNNHFLLKYLHLLNFFIVLMFPIYRKLRKI